MIRRLTLVACVLIVAILWLRSPEGDAGAPARPVLDTAAAATSAPEPVEALGESTAAEELRRAVSASTPTSATDAGRTLAGQPAGGLLVSVYDGSTGEWIEGAEVVLCESDGKLGMTDPGAALRNGTLDAAFEDRAKVRTTDVHGRASLFGAYAEGAVLARTADGRFGVAPVSAPQVRDAVDGVRLALRRDFDLSVRVVDAFGGGVAGVGVVLRRTQSVASNDYGLAESGADGVAILRHVGAALTRPNGSWRVQLAVVAEEPIGVELDPANPSASPVTLTLPATGAVELRLLDHDGAVYPLDVTAVLSSANTREPGIVLVAQLPTQSGVRVQDARGRAFFRHVALGQRLRATVVASGRVHSLEFDGPRVEGERMTVDFKLQSTLTCTGRALDEHGAPWKGPPLRAHVTTVDGQRWSQVVEQLQLGDDGSFRIDVSPAELPVAGFSLALELRDPRGGVLASGSAPILSEPARQDLGELRVKPTPILAAGRVFDSGGRPVAAAQVSVTGPESAGASERTTVTDERGEFALRGEWTGAIAVLRATWRGRSKFEQVEVGALGVELRFDPRGDVLGRLVHDERTRAMHFAVLARPMQATTRDGDAWSRVDTAGRFALLGLEPGEYELALHDQRLRCGIASFARVAIDASGDTHAPPLDAVDVARLVRPVRIDVANAFGLATQLEAAAWLASDLSEPRYLSWAPEQGLLLPTLEEDIQLELFAPGRLTQRMLAPHVDTIVELEAGPRVRLRLAADAAIAPPQCSYWVQLLSASDGEGASECLPLAHGVECDATATELGPVHVAVSLERRALSQAQGRTRRRLLPRSEWKLVTLVRGDEPTLEVTVSQGAVDETLAAFEADDDR